MLAACSGGGTDEATASPAWEFGPTIELAIQEATAAGASDEQIATLKRWLEVHDTPYADLEQSMQRFFACLNAAGIEHQYSGVAGGSDYPEPHYRVIVSRDLSDDAMQSIMADCDSQELYYVNMVYQLGPGVTARREREDAAYLPTAIDCLEEHGIALDEVATLDELNRFLAEREIEDNWGCTSPPYTNADS